MENSKKSVISTLIVIGIIFGIWYYIDSHKADIVIPSEPFQLKTPPTIDTSPCFNDEAVEVPCKG